MKRRAWLRGVVLGGGAVGTGLGSGLLGGCVTLDIAGPDQAVLQHPWRDLGPMPVRRALPLVDALLLQAVPGTPMADALSIAYEREGQALATYQYARWLERPLRVLPRVLQQRLEARGTAGVTAQLGDPQRADWLLTLRIDEIHHATLPAPGRGRLAVTAELFDRRQRQRVARRRFEAEAPAAVDAAAAAVAALSLALTQVLDALVPWLEGALGPAAGRGR